MYVLSFDSSEYAALVKGRLGGYNDYPPNMHYITLREWEEQFLCNPYSPEWIDHRQAWHRGSDGALLPPMQQLTLFILRDFSGWGYSREYSKGKGGEWRHRVKYFRFAYCEHEWEGVPEKSRMCYHVSRCKKCRVERHIDSSD